MGCNTSRIGDLPAVSLCHNRCKFLEEALYHCYALADANVAYMVSLKAVGSCLHRFNLDIDHSDSDHSADAESNLKSPSDFPEDEELDRDIDFLHPVHTNHVIDDDHTSNGNGGGLTWKTPSPPPAPSSSAWDFFNFFDTYDKYECIKEKGDRILEEPKMANNCQSSADVNVKLEEVAVVDASAKEQPKERDRANASTESKFREFDSLFLKATESGNELLRILGGGESRYPWFSSKMLRKSASTFPVLPLKNEEFFSTTQKTGSIPGHGSDEELNESSVNLSSTLMKLCIWEKKLYSEVKAEEKLRIIYAKKCRQMKILVEKRAKAGELDSSRTLLRVLFTNIKVAIRVIERISIMINKLRDEELRPLVIELMQKLVGMWKAMLEYHRSQYQAFAEPRLQYVISFGANFSDANLEALIQLNIEVQNWKSSFSNWINAQRGFVKALNGWLVKFLVLPSNSEQSPEVLSPFSPGRARGLPAVFVICKEWSLAVDRVSEIQVIEALHGFSRSINNLLEQNYIYLNQKHNPDKDTEERMVILEKEFQRMQKLMEIQGRKKLLAAKGGKGGLLLQETELDQLSKNMNSSLVLGLKQISIAMERFSASMVQSYKEIYLDIDHEKLDQE